MHIAIVTITCRTDPRFADMAKTLAHNVSRLGTDDEISWLIVDGSERDDLADVIDEIGDAGMDDIAIIGPPRSPWRDDGYPDPQTARNAALAELSDADYVVFLDDCTIVNNYWLEQVVTCAHAGHGYRCAVATIPNTVVPDSGEFRWPHAAPDMLAKCSATTVAGRCFGMPLEVLRAIGGFDMSYAGGMAKGDMDAFVRAERAGLVWMTNRRGWAVQLTATHDAAPIGKRDHDARNQRLFDALLADPTRIEPLNPWSDTDDHDYGDDDSGSDDADDGVVAQVGAMAETVPYKALVNAGAELADRADGGAEAPPLPPLPGVARGDDDGPAPDSEPSSD